MTFGSPTANRLKRPSWKDLRLFFGFLLVLVAVVGVVALVANADKTTEVYMAKQDIPVGQQVTEDLLDRTKTRLNDLQDRYQVVSEGPPESGFAIQRIPKGELVPKSSIDESKAVDRNPIALGLEENLPAGARPGSRVDVWASLPQAKTGGFDEPVLLLPGAEISQLENKSSGLGSSKALVVYVLVGKQNMPQILDALANKAKISVVWNPAGSQR